MVVHRLTSGIALALLVWFGFVLGLAVLLSHEAFLVSVRAPGVRGCEQENVVRAGMVRREQDLECLENAELGNVGNALDDVYEVPLFAAVPSALAAALAVDEQGGCADLWVEDWVSAALQDQVAQQAVLNGPAGILDLALASAWEDWHETLERGKGGLDSFVVPAVVRGAFLHVMRETRQNLNPWLAANGNETLPDDGDGDGDGDGDSPGGVTPLLPVLAGLVGAGPDLASICESTGDDQDACLGHVARFIEAAQIMELPAFLQMSDPSGPRRLQGPVVTARDAAALYVDFLRTNRFGSFGVPWTQESRGESSVACALLRLMDKRMSSAKDGPCGFAELMTALEADPHRTQHLVADALLEKGGPGCNSADVLAVERMQNGLDALDPANTEERADMQRNVSDARIKLLESCQPYFAGHMSAWMAGMWQSEPCATAANWEECLVAVSGSKKGPNPVGMPRRGERFSAPFPLCHSLLEGSDLRDYTFRNLGSCNFEEYIHKVQSRLKHGSTLGLYTVIGGTLSKDVQEAIAQLLLRFRLGFLDLCEPGDNFRECSRRAAVYGTFAHVYMLSPYYVEFDDDNGEYYVPKSRQDLAETCEEVLSRKAQQRSGAARRFALGLGCIAGAVLSILAAFLTDRRRLIALACALALTGAGMQLYGVLTLTRMDKAITMRSSRSNSEPSETGLGVASDGTVRYIGGSALRSQRGVVIGLSSVSTAMVFLGALLLALSLCISGRHRKATGSRHFPSDDPTGAVARAKRQYASSLHTESSSSWSSPAASSGGSGMELELAEQRTAVPPAQSHSMAQI